MAIAHIDLKPIQRSKGHSAVAAACYRAGERHIDPRTGVVHDYRRRHGVIDSRLVVPHGQDSPNRGEFWGRVEKSTNRSAAVVARHFDIALPHELSVKQQRALLNELTSTIVDTYGIAVDTAHHEPGMHGDVQGLNWHGHLLMTTAAVSANGSFGHKVDSLDPIWCKRHSVPNFADWLWPVWIEMANRHLEVAGCAERITLHEGAAPIPSPQPQEEKHEFIQHRFDDAQAVAGQQDLIEIRRSTGHGLLQLSQCRLAGNASETRPAERAGFDPRVLPRDARPRRRSTGVVRRSILNPAHVPRRRAGRTKPQEKHTHRPRVEIELEQQIRRMELRLESLQGERIVGQKPITADEEEFLNYLENLSMSNSEQSTQIATREQVDALLADPVKRLPFFRIFQEEDAAQNGSTKIDFRLWLLRRFDIDRDEEELAWELAWQAQQVPQAAGMEAEQSAQIAAAAQPRKWIAREAQARDLSTAGKRGDSLSRSRFPAFSGQTATGPHTTHHFDIYMGDELVAHVSVSDDRIDIDCADPELSAELALHHSKANGWPAAYVQGNDAFCAALLRQANDSEPPVPVFDRLSGKPLNDAARAHAEDQMKVTITSIAAAQVPGAPAPIYPLTAENIGFNQEEVVSWWRSAIDNIKVAFQKRWEKKTDIELDTKQIDQHLARKAFAQGNGIDPVVLVIQETRRAQHPEQRAMLDYLIATAGAASVAHELGQQGQPLPDWPELERLARERYEQEQAQLDQDSEDGQLQDDSLRPHA